VINEKSVYSKETKSKELPKHKQLGRLLVWVVLGMLVASCAGAPKPAVGPGEQPTETPTEQPAVVQETDPDKLPPDQATEAALLDQQGRTEKARKFAFDVGSPEFFADEWKAVEAQFIQAKELSQQKTMGTYKKATELYRQAADTYEALAQKALPLYAQKRKEDLQRLRSQAVTAGAQERVPELLVTADESADKAQALFDAKEYYGAIDAAIVAENRYVILAMGMKAYTVQQEIDRRNFRVYDESNYTLAESKLQESILSYKEGDLDKSRNAAEESLLRFNLALNKGKEMNARTLSDGANKERQAALDLKAHVAVKQDYDAANAVLAKAEAAFKAEKYDEAAELYQEAAVQFGKVRQVAAQKRQQAEEALQKAQAGITATEESARRANEILQGGAQ